MTSMMSLRNTSEDAPAAVVDAPAAVVVESALLTHGLASVSDDLIRDVWQNGWLIVWMDDGRPAAGDVCEFIEFRRRAADMKRINYFNYDEAAAAGLSGPLTASGAMRAAECSSLNQNRGTSKICVVSCGIGGLRPGGTAEASNDIRAMKAMGANGISLVATAFKDMFDAELSIRETESAGVRVRRLTEQWHPGYIFREAAREDAIKGGECAHDSAILAGRIISTEMNAASVGSIPQYENKFCPGTLYLNPVPAELLVADRGILEEAERYGREQAARGGAYHPAVNRRIDELTGGYSSEMQLRALCENIKTAEALMSR